MTEVTLKINNRGYSLSCDVGQEQRLADLGGYVNSRLNDIAAAGAATNEAHLLVLTSLVLADEVFEMREEMQDLRERINYFRQNPVAAPSALAEEEAMIAQAIEHLAYKIERIADRLQLPNAAKVA